MTQHTTHSLSNALPFFYSRICPAHRTRSPVGSRDWFVPVQLCPTPFVPTACWVLNPKSARTPHLPPPLLLCRVEESKCSGCLPCAFASVVSPPALSENGADNHPTGRPESQPDTASGGRARHPQQSGRLRPLRAGQHVRPRGRLRAGPGQVGEAGEGRWRDGGCELQVRERDSDAGGRGEGGAAEEVAGGGGLAVEISQGRGVRCHPGDRGRRRGAERRPQRRHHGPPQRGRRDDRHRPLRHVLHHLVHLREVCPPGPVQVGGGRGRRDRRRSHPVGRRRGAVVPSGRVDEPGGVLRVLRGGGAGHDGRTILREAVRGAEGQPRGGNAEMTIAGS